MEELLVPLEAFKEASLALEKDKSPTIHTVLSILKSLMFADERLHDPAYTTDHLAYYVSNASVNYLEK